MPKALLETFGKPKLVSLLDLAKRDKLAGADIQKVQQALIEQGFYLQMPPQPEDWLAEHKEWLADHQH